jgi:ATP synthase F1 gamma subunit
MRRASAIEKEMGQIVTVQDLTGVFESIASTRVAKVRDKVAISKHFFDRLWRIYQALRRDPDSPFGFSGREGNGRTVFVMISAEGGLSGDIDQRLIEEVLHDYDPSTTDLIVLGDHGAQQLTQRRIKFKNYFRVPQSESYVDVSPILKVIEPYKDITVYYETYVSLGVQEIKKINLTAEVEEMGAEAAAKGEVMTSWDTVFEPSLQAIIDFMEHTMVGLAFSQVILESGLAQDASRFNAMAAAKKRATDMVGEYRLEFHRAKRGESDRRLREVMISLKKKRHR